MTTTLTTKQIIAMADFAGLKVELHGLDIDDEAEYTLDDEHNLDCFDKSKPIFTALNIQKKALFSWINLTRRDAINKKAATERTARGRAGMKLIIYLCMQFKNS